MTFIQSQKNKSIMKKNQLHKILLLASFFMLTLYNNLYAQSFEPKVGTNYYYLTRGVWKLSSINLDTISLPAYITGVFNFTFYVGLPYNSQNIVTNTQNDTISDPLAFAFADATQKQIIIAPNTPNAQTITIDYIDDHLFIYFLTIPISGVDRKYQFIMSKVN
jgi:hypothetical protein